MVERQWMVLLRSESIYVRGPGLGSRSEDVQVLAHEFADFADLVLFHVCSSDRGPGGEIGWVDGNTR